MILAILLAPGSTINSIFFWSKSHFFPNQRERNTTTKKKTVRFQGFLKVTKEIGGKWKAKRAIVWRILQLCFFPINLLTAEWTLRALIDFTLSNARRFYWSTGNPLDGKGLKTTSDENGCNKVDIEPSGVQFWSEIKLQMISKLNSKSYDYLYNKYINSWTWFECISESAQLLEERWQISKWTNSPNDNVLIIRSLAMFLSWVQYEWSCYQDKITGRKKSRFQSTKSQPRKLSWDCWVKEKDDILIYDRCRLLVDHFSIPHSYLGYPFVKLTDISINLVPRFFRGFNMRFAAMLEA